VPRDIPSPVSALSTPPGISSRRRHGEKVPHFGSTYAEGDQRSVLAEMVIGGHEALLHLPAAITSMKFSTPDLDSSIS
jgi:hypothetical protein